MEMKAVWLRKVKGFPDKVVYPLEAAVLLGVFDGEHGDLEDLWCVVSLVVTSVVLYHAAWLSTAKEKAELCLRYKEALGLP